MKNIAILGSTGSIGKSALEVIRHFPDKFRIAGLSTNSNIDVLCQQIKEFHPQFVCVSDKVKAIKLEAKLKSKIKLFAGQEGLEALVGQEKIEKILIAISGSAALPPLLKAVACKKQIALANKEALVMAGPIIMNEAASQNLKLIPVDSEQSAIWQCLDGQTHSMLKNIYLTASGGPFRQTLQRKLRNVSIKEVLRHPRWKMGKKISVDSANLMNKGLELLEAMFLFGQPYDKIKILIHPEAVLHSMVEFIDGVILAQLSVADMRIPIQYALTYPERLCNGLPSIDFYKLKELHFEAPDFKRFPCLRLAYRVASELGTMPAVFNAANEVSAQAFLNNRLRFISIPTVIERVLERHRNKQKPNLEDIQEADRWAREDALRVMEKLN